VHLEAFTTVLLWITPWSEVTPKPPATVTVRVMTDRTEIHWTPSVDPHFYSYELHRLDGLGESTRVGPDPLRSATWTDDRVPPGTRYKVRTVSTSGSASEFTISE
jgi:hypothetical protein